MKKGGDVYLRHLAHMHKPEDWRVVALALAGAMVRHGDEHPYAAAMALFQFAGAEYIALLHHEQDVKGLRRLQTIAKRLVRILASSDEARSRGAAPDGAGETEGR